jgi:23S rRNA (adenine-N6)-dimethyltransferase
VSAGRETRWGWHRLAERSAARLVAAAGVQAGDLVIDVGAGEGAITAPLVRAGARVIAIELYPARAKLLRARFAGASVTVVQVDAVDLRLPRRPFLVVANLPFSATTAVLRRLLSPGSQLIAARLLVPHYVAQRWIAGRAPGAGRWQATFEVRLDGMLARSALLPPARSPVAVLAIERRGR